MYSDLLEKWVDKEIPSEESTSEPRRKSSAKSYVEDIVDEDDIEAPEDMDVDAEIPEEEEASEGQNSASDETESEGKGDTHISTF